MSVQHRLNFSRSQQKELYSCFACIAWIFWLFWIHPRRFLSKQLCCAWTIFYHFVVVFFIVARFPLTFSSPFLHSIQCSSASKRFSSISAIKAISPNSFVKTIEKHTERKPFNRRRGKLHFCLFSKIPYSSFVCEWKIRFVVMDSSRWWCCEIHNVMMCVFIGIWQYNTFNQLDPKSIVEKWAETHVINDPVGIKCN